MHPSEVDRGAGRDEGASDWRCWVSLGWVAVFGALYARMVIQERAPGAWEAIRGLLGSP